MAVLARKIETMLKSTVDEIVDALALPSGSRGSRSARGAGGSRSRSTRTGRGALDSLRLRRATSERTASECLTGSRPGRKSAACTARRIDLADLSYQTGPTYSCEEQQVTFPDAVAGLRDADERGVGVGFDDDGFADGRERKIGDRQLAVDGEA